MGISRSKNAPVVDKKNSTTVTVESTQYTPATDAVIITCYFNPTGSAYRYENFKTFYETIKHLDHRIVECVIGDQTPQLQDIPNVTVVRTKVLLWHKESLLNVAIKALPPSYKYVFWLDADIIFTNKNWLVESVEKLRDKLTIVQASDNPSPFHIAMFTSIAVLISYLLIAF